MTNIQLKMATLSVSFFSILTIVFINNQISEGHIKVNFLGISMERTIEATDLEKILRERSGLITAIKKLNYHDEFSHDLRKMHQHSQGPFSAPEVTVELAFSDSIDIDRAQVCADSMFLNRSMTIATHDYNNMDMIENANEILLLECPAKERKIEKVVVAKQFGARLLGTDETPTSVAAIAKPIQNIRFIKKPNEAIEK